jgi:spore coat protein U-like protein
MPVQITLDKGPLVGPGGASGAYTLDAPTSAIGQGREPVNLKVMGTVAGGQTVPPGDYTGEVIVRLDY